MRQTTITTAAKAAARTVRQNVTAKAESSPTATLVAIGVPPQIEIAAIAQMTVAAYREPIDDS